MKAMKWFLIMLICYSSQALALGDNIEEVLGYKIGEALPKEYFEEAVGQYPTRLIYSPVLDDMDNLPFDIVQIQMIESSKRVYSLIAKKELDSMSSCNKYFKKLMDYFDTKYSKLKVAREVEIDGEKFSTFDGYLSSDGKRKLSLDCSKEKIEDKTATLGISVWHKVLSNEAEKLWEKY